MFGQKANFYARSRSLLEIIFFKNSKDCVKDHNYYTNFDANYLPRQS